MKLDSNMETDRLLQRYARRRRDASLQGANSGDAFAEEDARDNQGGTMHLDADELVAYAENALPVQTRLRYTDHLSDCGSCRKLVTELVVSSGVAASLVREAVPFQPQTRSWRDWLAVIFAPRVLRYAASVILLVGIASIALVVYQGGFRTKFLDRSAPAENNSGNESSGDSASTTTEQKSGSGNGNSARTLTDSEDTRTVTGPGAATNAQTDAPREVPTDIQKAGQEQAQAKPPAPAVTAIDGQSEEASTTRHKDAELAERRQPATGTDKLKARKETEGAGTTGRISREATARAESDENSSSDSASVAQGSTTAKREEKSAAGSRARSNAAGPPKNAAPMTSTEDRKSRADGGVTDVSRVVGGKQFVRRNGAWVDVAYSSQATTNVKRGSDQYRALVADEPGLRTIANQLGGDVVVVWKGRAYRIY